MPLTVEDYSGDPICVYFLPDSHCDRVDVSGVGGGRGKNIPLAHNAADFICARRANIWNVTGSFMVGPLREPASSHNLSHSRGRACVRACVRACCETHRQPASRDSLSLFRKSGSPLFFSLDREGVQCAPSGHPCIVLLSRDGNEHRRLPSFFFPSVAIVSRLARKSRPQYIRCEL